MSLPEDQKVRDLKTKRLGRVRRTVPAYSESGKTCYVVKRFEEDGSHKIIHRWQDELEVLS